MKQKSLKKHSASSDNGQPKNHYSAVIVMALGILVLAAIMYFLDRSPSIDSKSVSTEAVQKESSAELKPQARYDETLRRAYAIDK